MIKKQQNIIAFILLIFSWWIVGVFATPLVYIYMPITWIILFRNDQFEGLFFGFISVLIMSDSLNESMAFAGNIKPFYLLFMGVILINNREKIGLNLKIFVALIPFFLIAIFCLIWSESFMIAIQKTVSYLLLYLVIPSFTYYFLQKDNGILRRFNYYTIAVLLFSTVLYFLEPEIAISHGGRFRGVFGNPNGLGLYIIVAFLFYQVSILKNPKNLSQNEKTLLLGLVLFSVIFSGSRNAIISIFIFYTFFFVYKKFKYLGVLISLILIPGIYYAMSNAVEIIHFFSLGKLFRVENIVEGSGRLIAWEFVWPFIQENFFLGKGIGFDEFLMRKNAKYLSVLGHEGGVHNSYLIIWLNTGIAGLIAFFLAKFYLFIKAFNKVKIAIPVLLAILFSITFEPWISSSLNPFTSVYLMLLTLLLYQRKTSPISTMNNET